MTCFFFNGGMKNMLKEQHSKQGRDVKFMRPQLLKKNALPTDQWTNKPMDPHQYIDVRMHLKI